MRLGDYHGRVVGKELRVFETHADAVSGRYSEGRFNREDVVVAIALMKFVGSRNLTGTPSTTPQTYRLGNAVLTLALTATTPGSEHLRHVETSNRSYNIHRVTATTCSVGCTEITRQQAERILELL